VAAGLVDQCVERRAEAGVEFGQVGSDVQGPRMVHAATHCQFAQHRHHSSWPGQGEAFTMKWLCIASLAGLNEGVVQHNAGERDVADGCVECPQGGRVATKDSARISARGYSRAILAVVGSSFTLTACTPGGARPMNVPEPHPGSRTRPPSNSQPPHASHIGVTIAGSV